MYVHTACSASTGAVRHVRIRVARWHILLTKNPDLGKFGGSCNGGVLYGHLVYFTAFGIFVAIWYTLCSFGIFFTLRSVAPRKNLATLVRICSE
jgi:hypothetical protein